MMNRMLPINQKQHHHGQNADEKDKREYQRLVRAEKPPQLATPPVRLGPHGGHPLESDAGEQG